MRFFLNLLYVPLFTAEGACLCTYVCSVVLLWWMTISQVSSNFSLIEGRHAATRMFISNDWGVVLLAEKISRHAGKCIYSRFIHPLLDPSHFRSQLVALRFPVCQDCVCIYDHTVTMLNNWSTCQTLQLLCFHEIKVIDGFK